MFLPDSPRQPPSYNLSLLDKRNWIRSSECPLLFSSAALSLFTIFRLGCQPCIYYLSPPAVVYSFLLLCDLVRSFSRCYCRIFVFVVVVAGYSFFFSLLCLVKVVISLLRITVSFHPLNSVRYIEYFCASPLSFFFFYFYSSLIQLLRIPYQALMPSASKASPHYFFFLYHPLTSYKAHFPHFLPSHSLHIPSLCTQPSHFYYKPHSHINPTHLFPYGYRLPSRTLLTLHTHPLPSPHTFPSHLPTRSLPSRTIILSRASSFSP